MRQDFVLSLMMVAFLGIPPASYPAGNTAADWSVSPAGSTLQTVLTTPTLRVGQNRVAFGLLLDHTTFLTEAEVIVRAYALQDAFPRLQTEMRAFYEPLAGSGRRRQTEPEMEGLYVAQVPFDRPGLWGFEVFVAQDDGPVAVLRFTAEVLDTP